MFRVVELTCEATAPCGRILAEAGTDLVLVDTAPRDHLDPWSLFHHTGKRSVAADLATGEGRERLAGLAAVADVLVEGLPPGRLEELGLGYEHLRAANPGLVLVSITPFGQTGPYSRYAGGDLVTFAMGGVMYITGSPERPPVVAPDCQSFALAGAHASAAALAALWARERTGAGDWIDVSMHECWAAQENTITNFLGPGRYARRHGSQHRTSLPGRIFRCRDGFIHVFVSRETPVWRRFLEWIGDPPELGDPALADINTRWRHADLVDGVSAQFFAARTRGELVERAQELHLPCVPVYSLEEFIADPQTSASDPVAEVRHPELGTYRTLRPPTSAAFGFAPAHAPRPGEHTEEVARDWAAPWAGHATPLGAPNSKPLANLRVCAFTHVAAGPYATLQLAYAGADVIKVESRTRIDYWRYRDRNDDPEGSRPFADHNKNVRSVTLNLRTPEGVELARRLAVVSDIVIDNFSAGVMDRLGLGYETLRQLREDVVVVHMTGLGSSGPHSHHVTFGPSLMSLCGLTLLWNHPDNDVPVGSQSSYPDFLAGAYTAHVMLAALHRRKRTGQGALLDLSQAQITAAAIGPSYTSLLNGLGVPTPVGNRSATEAPHGCYPCLGDDAWCVIAVRSDDEWRRLRSVMGEPAWTAEDWAQTAESRLARRAQLDEGIAAWTRLHAAREVMRICQEQGVAAAIVATGEDIAGDPHLATREFLLEGSHPVLGRLRLPGSPVRFHGTAADAWRMGPLLGEDNDAVLTGVLGLSAAEIARYAAADALT